MANFLIKYTFVQYRIHIYIAHFAKLQYNIIS